MLKTPTMHSIYLTLSDLMPRIQDNALGSKIGPNYACLFVGYVEHQIREQYTGFIPPLHRRYIDDIVGADSCRREELEAYLNFVSNFHPSLQFTSTITETELPFLIIKLRISDARIQTSFHYKDTDTHNYLHFSSFHPDHCKRAFSCSQFLRLRQLCSDDDDFLVRSREMVVFLPQRFYPRSSLQRVATISRLDALRPSEQSDTTVDSVPLVLTDHPFNTKIKLFLLQNFRILSTDQQTRSIFPQPPFVAYKRDLSLRIMLVYSTDTAFTEQPGSRACQRPRCNTCNYISSIVEIRGPRCSFP